LNEPETPMSAYNLFFQEERARLLGIPCILILRRGKKRNKQKSEPHGVISFKDLSRHIAKTWRELSYEKRKRYTDLFEETKAKYKEEMKAYEAALNNAFIRAKLFVSRKSVTEEECTDQTSVDKIQRVVKEFHKLSRMNQMDEESIQDKIGDIQFNEQENPCEAQKLVPLTPSFFDIHIIQESLDDLLSPVEEMRKKTMKDLEADLHYLLEDLKMFAHKPLFSNLCT